MKARYLFILLSIASILGACKKFLEIEPPKTKLVTETTFNNDSTAVAALRGMYSNFGSVTGFAASSSSSITYNGALSADELKSYSTSSSIVGFYSNALSPINFAELSTLWNTPYKAISEANAIIEGLGSSNDVSEPIKRQLLGEAKFIRAFCHFYLVNLFGDVPLILTTDYRLNTNAIRTPKAQVYAQIIQDLKDAQGLLAENYSYSANQRIRPNKFAATALLARTYLYTNAEWSNAELQATAVIDNKTLYDTVALNNVFLKNSKEAIWQLLPQAGSNTQEGANFVLTTIPSTGSTSNSTLSDGLLSAFEFGDKRRTNWVGSYTTTTTPITTYYFPYKYKVKQSATQTEYSMVLRLGEQYLIRAEARIQQNKITDGISDLNVIRKRAGLSPLSTSLSKDAALLAVEQERRIEMFTEWGHRWLDLKRTNRANTIMPAVTTAKGGTWKSEWQLYPIPQAQLLNDPAMIGAQNPGYN